MIIVNNYKTTIVPNNSLNPVHPIAVAQAKPQLKDLMLVALPFKLTTILLKDATVGFVSIQTICYLLWVGLCRV